MKTTKQQLELQVKHVCELLNDHGAPIDLSIEYAYGQPRLVCGEGSRHISIRQSKNELDSTIYAIKNVLYEIRRNNDKSSNDNK